MPNQWERSCRLQCQHRYKLQAINAKPVGTILQALVSTPTQAPNYQCQTNGRDLISLYVSTRKKLLSYLNQNGVYPIQRVFRNLCYRLIYIFKRFAQIYIIVVKLITLCSQSNCITSFEKLRISAIRFTDKVQRNLSRYVLVYLLHIYVTRHTDVQNVESVEITFTVPLK